MSEWISCKDRLPDINEQVLVTDVWNGIDVMTYMPDYPNEPRWEDYYSTSYEQDEIIAWMSLPEPYKGE